jgi:hypothetical protein
LLLAACCALLAACGSGDRAGADHKAAGDVGETLPKPEAGSGSITGMPDRPGPGAVGTGIAGATTSVPPIVAGDALPAPQDADALPAPPPDTTPPPATAEPTPADAVAVIDA